MPAPECRVACCAMGGTVEVVLFGCVAIHVCVCTAATHIKYKEHAPRDARPRPGALPPRRPRARRALPRSRVEGRAVATLSLVSSTSRRGAAGGTRGGSAAALPLA